jgi:hypothetical protein
MALVALTAGLDWRVILVDGTGSPLGTVGNPINTSSGGGGSTVSGAKSNNAVAPGSTNLGVLPAVANAAAPTYTEGNQVLLSTDLSGRLRTLNTQIGTWNVTVNTALPAGTNSIGTVVLGAGAAAVGSVSVSNFPATQPVSGTVTAAPLKGTLTDRSGTIAAGGTAQTLAAVNASRTYLVIQNNSTGDLWINFTTAAVVSQPSLKLAVGATYISDPQFISTELVSIIGATTGQTYTAKEV